MIRRSQIAVSILLATVIASIAPVSAIFYSQGHNQQNTAEKFVELADRAGQKVEGLIDLVYANETALETIEDAGFLDELEGNVTLYYEGLQNVTNAYYALEVGDYEGAIANACMYNYTLTAEAFSPSIDTHTHVTWKASMCVVGSFSY